MFSSGRDYIERPATTQNQTTKSNVFKSIANKNNNNPQQEEDEVNDDQLPILRANSWRMTR